MLNRLPTPVQCPQLAQILDNLGNPAPPVLARAMGVSEPTARRWIRQGHAPRPVLLALFWLTSWGMSAVDAEITNRCQLTAGMVSGLACENERLRAELARVVAAGDFGCANDPTVLTTGSVAALDVFARWA